MGGETTLYSNRLLLLLRLGNWRARGGEGFTQVCSSKPNTFLGALTLLSELFGDEGLAKTGTLVPALQDIFYLDGQFVKGR